MALQQTSRDASTGGVDVFAVVASMESHNLQQGAEIIDAPTGQPGWTTVRRTAGRAPQPHDHPLRDPSATSYGPLQPPIQVTITKGD